MSNVSSMFLCSVCKVNLEKEHAYFINKGIIMSYYTRVHAIHPDYSNVTITYKVLVPDNLKCFCIDCFESIAGKDYL